jgi:hypothetical protein
VKPWLVAALVAVDVVLYPRLPYPWNGVVALIVCAGCLAVVVLIVRGVRRDRGFVSLSGYEWHRQAPEHVKDEGVAEGTVLPEKRIER